MKSIFGSIFITLGIIILIFFGLMIAALLSHFRGVPTAALPWLVSSGLLFIYSGSYMLILERRSQRKDKLSKIKTPEQITAFAGIGFDVNLKDSNGCSPLMNAIMQNENTDIISAWIKAGADIDVRNKKGETPLMAAVSSNHVNKINVLINAGADISLKNKDDKTVFDIAAATNNPDILNLLEEARKNAINISAGKKKNDFHLISFIRRAAVSAVALILFLYVNILSSFGIAASIRNPISEPGYHGRRWVGFNFIIPLLIEVVALIGVFTEKDFKEQKSGIIWLCAVIIIYGVLVFAGMGVM